MPNKKNGDIVKCKVTGIENYGIFVLTEDGYAGLIHISQISEKFVRNVCDYVQMDDEIFAKIIECDEVSHRLKLSIKNFNYHMDGSGEEEICNGFGPLKEQLPIWIDEYNFSSREKVE